MINSAYACYNSDEDIRRDSTSGGVFSLIAKYIICNKQGVVFGAVFDEKFNVVHKYTENLDGISEMRGSKYSQSELKDTFKSVKAFLDDGRSVFFSGTPCQVNALYNFLQRDYVNLLTMDFVCHGVSSPQIWSDYLYSIGKDQVKYVRFKDKAKGWKTWYLKIMYGNKIFYQRGRVNKYMKSYLQYANIRPSCYECRFKGDNRKSDFTISDCWGAGEHDKEINDNRGLSALILNTDKSNDVFEAIKDSLVYKSYDKDELMMGNWTYYKSVSKNPCREEFFSTWRQYGVKKAINKYFSPGISGWIYYIYLRLVGVEK